MTGNFDTAGVQNNSNPAHPPRRAPDDERAFLWCVLNSTNGRPFGDTDLRVDQFGERRRGIIYREMVKLHAERGSINWHELRGRLSQLPDGLDLVAEFNKIDGLSPQPCIPYADQHAENIIGTCKANEVRRQAFDAIRRIEQGDRWDEVAEAQKSFLGSSLGETRNKKRLFEKFMPPSIGEFLAQQDDRPRWLIDNLITADGLALAVAQPKVGKSTLCWDLVRCVVNGLPFLSRKTTKGGAVLCALEDSASELRRTFRNMGLKDGDDFHPFVGAPPEDHLGWLRWLVETFHPSLIVIDPLIAFLRPKKIEDYAEIYGLLLPVNDIARKSGTSIVLAHHNGKTEREDSNDYLGSTSLLGAVDTMLKMKGRGSDPRTIQSLQRRKDPTIGDMPESVLQLDPATGAVFLAGRLEDVQQERVEAQIIELLDDGPRTEKEIRESVGGDERKICNALRDLHARKKAIIREGKGVKNNPYTYRLPAADGSDSRFSFSPKDEPRNENDSPVYVMTSSDAEIGFVSEPKGEAP